MRLKENKPAQEKLSICAIILAAGMGSRTGLGYNKMLYYVGKKTILEMTIDRLINSRVGSIVVVVSECDQSAIKQVIKPYNNVSVCLGGATRTESVRKGLNEITSCDIVVIHDGARPYVTSNIINKSIESAVTNGSGIVAVPTVDTIKEIKNNTVVRTLTRSGLFNIQTPQTFRYDEIQAAYKKVQGNFNDDSEIYERAGYTPFIVIGDYENVKITSMHDLYRVSNSRSRIGVGFDVHPLVPGKKLVLGGICIPNDKGLKGHSDADVLVHAVMDSLLSAAGMPDIGVVFPNTDPQYHNISSMVLLNTVYQLIISQGFKVGNISAVIMAEKPKLAGVISQIRDNLARTLRIMVDQINVSATTTEQLGIVGEEKGIAASATCLLFY